MSLGIVIGPGIGGFLAKYGLKMPLLVSAIVGVLFLLLILAFQAPSMALPLEAYYIGMKQTDHASLDLSG